MKVLSYNIHKGFSVGNSKFVLEKIRSAIRTTGAELVFLQEVLGEHDTHRQTVRDWPAEPQFEYLADEIWPHFAYGKNAVYTEGHHGNAVLSRYPIRLWENIDISVSKFAKRGLLHVVIDLPNQIELHAICLHLDLFSADRQTQASIVEERIDSHVPAHCPLIIAGDFNDWTARLSRHFEEKLNLQEVFLSTSGRHARTFPAKLPALKLDRIYFRGLSVLNVKKFSKKPWSELSDHLAILAEFGLPSRS